MFSFTPFPPVSCSLVNSLCRVPSTHLSCTFHPIITPTWDCTQDNVGIFDNMDCENETLFWINNTVWSFQREAHPFPASSCIISNITLSFSARCPVPSEYYYRKLSASWMGIENVCFLRHVLPGYCDLTNPWICNINASEITGYTKGILLHSFSYLCLKASDIFMLRRWKRLGAD